MSSAPQPSTQSERLPAHQQALRFLAVGIVSAIVDYGLLQLLMIFLELHYSQAKAISFVFGTLTAYLLNRRFTFQAEHTWRRFFTVMALYGLMFAVQFGLFTPITAWLLSHGVARSIATTIGFVIGQGVATVTNFIVQRTVIYRHGPAQPVPITEQEPNAGQQ